MNQDDIDLLARQKWTCVGHNLWHTPKNYDCKAIYKFEDAVKIAREEEKRGHAKNKNNKA